MPMEKRHHRENTKEKTQWKRYLAKSAQFNSGPDGYVSSIVVERYHSGRMTLFEGYSPTTKKPVHFDKRLTVSLLDQTINRNRSKRLTLGTGTIAAGICGRNRSPFQSI
jgi:hypothetical protein